MNPSRYSFPRLCVLIESYYPVVGGMETGARSLAASLASRGIRLFFVTRRIERNLKKKAEVDGITVYRVPPSGGNSRLRWVMILTCIFALARQRNNYDIIFVPGFRVLGISAVIISKIFRKKCILRAESNGEMSGEFFTGGLKQFNLTRSNFFISSLISIRNKLLARADAFVSMSSELTSEFISCGVPRESVYLIPQGVDVDEFHPVSSKERFDLRGKLRLPKNDKLVVFTGRLVSYKGIPLLLKVWDTICQNHGAVKLVIVGTGGTDMFNCENELKQFVESRGLQENVIFTGAVDNVNEYLQSCDIFVFPTSNEAFGISLIEAMACGLAVISTTIGGIKDIIIDGKNGLAIEPENQVQLQSAMEKLMNDPVLCETIGKNAVQTVCEKYTTDITALKYIDLLNKYGNRSRVPPLAG